MSALTRQKRWHKAMTAFTVVCIVTVAAIGYWDASAPEWIGFLILGVGLMITLALRPKWDHHYGVQA